MCEACPISFSVVAPNQGDVIGNESLTLDPESTLSFVWTTQPRLQHLDAVAGDLASRVWIGDLPDATEKACSPCVRYIAGMRVGGYDRKPDYPKLGPSLLIASCVIRGLRTAKWAIRDGSSTASDRDLDVEVENAIHLAKRVLSQLLARDAGLFPSVKEPWYQPTDEEVLK